MIQKMILKEVMIIIKKNNYKLTAHKIIQILNNIKNETKFHVEYGAYAKCN